MSRLFGIVETAIITLVDFVGHIIISSADGKHPKTEALLECSFLFYFLWFIVCSFVSVKLNLNLLTVLKSKLYDLRKTVILIRSKTGK